MSPIPAHTCAPRTVSEACAFSGRPAVATEGNSRLHKVVEYSTT